MLKCIDCDSQICPKCMVQCPVGNRCPNCTKRFTSHVLQVDSKVIVRCLLASIVVGFLFGLLQIFIPLDGIYMLFFVYLFGVFAGNIMFKLTGHKLGRKVAATIAAGILVGSFSSINVTLIIFIFGVVSPFLGWNLSLPWFRR